MKRIEELFVTQLRHFVVDTLEPQGFYRLDSQEDSRERVEFLKQVIENEDGWRIFYVDGKAVESEKHLQTLFKFVWFGSDMDVNPEPNKGRGPVDFKVSMGSRDKTLIEFKLAKNTHLEKNLAKQVAIYEEANKHPVPPKPSLKVILYFTEAQEKRARAILDRLGFTKDPNVVLIDARATTTSHLLPRHPSARAHLGPAAAQAPYRTYRAPRCRAVGLLFRTC